MTLGLGIDPGPQWREESALTNVRRVTGFESSCFAAFLTQNPCTSFDAAFSSLPLADSLPRDLQITAYK